MEEEEKKDDHENSNEDGGSPPEAQGAESGARRLDVGMGDPRRLCASNEFENEEKRDLQ